MIESLPPGWASATLADVAKWGSGGTPKKSESSYYGGDIPWAVIGDLNDRIVNSCSGSITKYGLRNSSCKLVDPGTILIAMYGSIGKLGISGVQMTTNQAIAFATPLLDRRFLFYYLLAQRQEFSAAGKGATQKNISQTILRQWPIPVAPLKEQSRIVAAIEEHLSRLDAVEAAQRQIIRQNSILKSSLLTDAFRLGGDLPPGWGQQSIGEVAQVQLGRQRSPEHHEGPQMRPYLRSANVTWEGVSLEDVKEMNFDDADFENYKLEPGDLLLNEASGSPGEVGKPAIWAGEIENCCFQNTLLRLRFSEVDSQYLYWYCYASALSGRFGNAGRGVNIRHLGKRGLSEFPIPIAPREEQGEIAVRLDQQFELTKRLEQTAQEVLDRVAALRRAVLSGAFSGQLVHQDPDDEPASVLLERIAATRQPGQKTRRKAKE